MLGSTVTFANGSGIPPIVNQCAGCSTTDRVSTITLAGGEGIVEFNVDSDKDRRCIRAFLFNTTAGRQLRCGTPASVKCAPGPPRQIRCKAGSAPSCIKKAVKPNTPTAYLCDINRFRCVTQRGLKKSAVAADGTALSPSLTAQQVIAAGDPTGGAADSPLAHRRLLATNSSGSTGKVVYGLKATCGYRNCPVDPSAIKWTCTNKCTAPNSITPLAGSCSTGLPYEIRYSTGGSTASISSVACPADSTTALAINASLVLPAGTPSYCGSSTRFTVTSINQPNNQTGEDTFFASP
ncbi:hypothetical protein MNEG_0769 [Monoraphidium neglectum]|uniref:Uncharacterized protein n=1 Tax=Monoraphidium neglectum TaxID=145388 RepID=A0A0D2MXJ5_9CHLO|nr:hypothetical protein MNEG_0769 [Monoraphidium neglectum]KIZ07195.1 hypothetical protein MNEG_0769 [Monoraphidium neglectum]|eukprot:XP_013906214.1 hypothetical protein MNEG_0769 [Monoraphidium neglectum]